MAPPPEYDKEPKAPDKNVTTACSDDSKVLYTIIKDQQQIPDHKGTTTTLNAEAENNKDVETLDDGQLRALLDEAITYKCPKDREGKSNLFKELLHEVEQDEQACEAARGLSAGRGARRGARGRRELQSNSLQDLVAAMAAEPAPRRPRNHPPAQVSARAHHGGSLPSGVDTSFLLSEEPPTGGGGYLATVRCVNPPPLAERRVSASDAHAPADVDLLARRSKPTFPMTYTARATLEIGSGSVCSGRAVTTTTASNQVRTTPVTAPRTPRRPRRDNPERPAPPPAPHRDSAPPAAGLTGRMKLLNAMCPKTIDDDRYVDGGGIHEDASRPRPDGAKNGVPRGRQTRSDPKRTEGRETSGRGTASKHDHLNQRWVNSVHNWYDSLDNMKPLLNPFAMSINHSKVKIIMEKSVSSPSPNTRARSEAGSSSGVEDVYSPNENFNSYKDTVVGGSALYNISNNFTDDNYSYETDFDSEAEKVNSIPSELLTSKLVNRNLDTDIILRKKYRERVGYDLVPPNSMPASPTFFKKATIGPSYTTSHEPNQLSEKSTNNAHSPKNIKNLVRQHCHEDTNSSVSRDSSVDSRKKFEKKSNRDALVLDNIAVESDKSELNVVNLNEFQSVSDGNTSVSNHQELRRSSNPKHCECEKENRNECKSEATASTVCREANIETFNTKKVDMKRSRCDSKDKNSNDDTELLVVELREPLSTPSSRSNETSSNIMLNSSCDSGDTTWANEIELADIPLGKQNVDHSDDFAHHLAVQQRFLKNLENNDSNDGVEIKRANDLVEVGNEEVEENNEPEIITHVRTNKELVPAKDNVEDDKENVKEKFIFAELPNNAYVFLTLPQSFFNNVTTKEIESNNNVTPYTSGEHHAAAKRSKTKGKHKRDQPEKSARSANVANKSALKLLLYGNSSEQCLASSGLSVNCDKEVDSAIPFTCITTPEVVASCNTTSSTPQSAAAADPKPLQLGSCYRAVSSLTGSWAPAAAAPPDSAAELQPRSVISSSFNGLPLSRPNYGSTGTTANDEYKKSLDENGNAVQGFSSPLSGSSQQKKPRRKKSTKNETVIKSHQIDGYQGNKDLNEVLRFIESNADTARGNKPGRAKHKDDSDDKGKKRSSSRKDKESKAKRASSLEELSRTKLEDLTAAQPRAPPAKPERRSWGDDARDAFYLREPDAAELTDFQTVTKKRKPRRRTDDAAADPPRRPRAPSPRRAPSDRSNDSNDDLDSVHSLPATRAPPAPHASYADIARTRHNIPDLIESCNFYAEGETRETRAAPPADADYPALATRRRKPGGAGARAAPRNKERAEPPAPDVVADRRPPVVLLDSAARPRDMDGVTFGFDVNEQLLGAPPGRAAGGARCDLLRDTEDGAPGPAGRAVPVALAAGGAALRYVPPPAAPLAPHLHHLHRIVDYVGAAWEDVVRCGGGKVRYFSE